MSPPDPIKTTNGDYPPAPSRRGESDAPGPNFTPGQRTGDQAPEGTPSIQSPPQRRDTRQLDPFGVFGTDSDEEK